MALSIERLLMDDARAVPRDDPPLVMKGNLRRTCDRAFALLDDGVRHYGRRAKKAR